MNLDPFVFIFAACLPSAILFATCLVLAYAHATTRERLRAARIDHLETLTQAHQVNMRAGRHNNPLLAALLIAIGKRYGIDAVSGVAWQTPGTYPRISIRGEVPPPFAAELSARVYGGAGGSERDAEWTHFRHRDDPSLCTHEEAQ